MKTTALGAPIVQVTLLRFVNAFLVRQDDGLTLVDTLLPRNAGGLLEAARWSARRSCASR